MEPEPEETGTKRTPEELQALAPPNWFAYSKPNFETYLNDYIGKPDVQMLQIGAYTGDCSLWILNNILTGPRSHLIDVDTWLGSADEVDHQNLNWQTIWNIYRVRLQGYPVTPLRMTSDEYFQFFQPQEQFDIIYIDGGHTKDQVTRDADNSDTALKPGGILIFDDYTWVGGTYGNRPVDAIEPFIKTHRDDYDIIVLNDQVWLEKH